MKNGLIIVNKEQDYTSRDIVNIISKKFQTKKVGHTGTLDPLAKGVLVVCIGEATKVSELLTSTFKEYIATVKIGLKTDTLDITGKIIEEKKEEISKEKIINVLNEMMGSYEQEVPIYSAVKVNGKKLYEYARNNEEVILPKKEVEIKKIELLDYSNDTFKFRTLVSKGTYIRSLIRDICDKLGIIGVMSDLIRTKQGDFNIENSYTLEEIKNDKYEIISIEESLNQYKKIEVDNTLENKIKNGCLLENNYGESPIIFLNADKKLLAIYKVYEKDNTKIKPWKGFNL